MCEGRAADQSITSVSSAEQENQQVLVFPTIASVELTTQATVAPKESGDPDNSSAPEKVAESVSEAQTNLPKVSEAETTQPQPPRGDGPANRAQVGSPALKGHVWVTTCSLGVKLIN